MKQGKTAFFVILFCGLLILSSVYNTGRAESLKQNTYEDEPLGIGATADEVPCAVMKKNETIRFTWTEIEGADHYRYSFRDLKSGRRVKYVRTSALSGFLPKELNDKNTTYELELYGMDSAGKTIETRRRYFHIEKVVVEPKGRIDYPPELSVDQEHTLGHINPEGIFFPKDNE